MGDSIIAGLDTYDLQIYAMGKGPTAITVSAPDSSMLKSAKRNNQRNSDRQFTRHKRCTH